MKAAVHFHRCELNVHVGGGDDSRMRSRVFFDLVLPDGQVRRNGWVEVSQPHGVDYHTEPLEMGQVQDLPGPSGPHWTDLSNLVETYYRMAIGQHGRAVRFPAGARMVMTDVTITMPWRAEIEVPETSGGGW